MTHFDWTKALSYLSGTEGFSLFGQNFAQPHPVRRLLDNNTYRVLEPGDEGAVITAADLSSNQWELVPILSVHLMYDY
jgi:hypothetical protein